MSIDTLIDGPAHGGLVDAKGLLKAVWPDEASRPSKRWLDRMKKARRVPFMKIGGKVFYSPPQVMRSLESQAVRAVRGGDR